MCDSFPQKLDVQTSDKPSNNILWLVFVVNIKSQATYHTIVPSTKELLFNRSPFHLLFGLYCIVKYTLGARGFFLAMQ